MIKSLNEKEEKRVEIDLTGPEGNAFVLMGYANRFGKQLGLDTDKIIEEMKSGDYDNLVKTFDSYFGDFVILYTSEQDEEFDDE
jgi:hypothetical protein